MPLEFGGTIITGMVTQRTLNRIANDTNRETLLDHVQNRLPGHFERNANTAPGGTYGYTARTRLYQIRKAKRVGHQRPNVLTGQLRFNVLSHPKRKVRATKSRATFRASNAGHFPLSRQRREEIEAVPSFQAADIAEFWRDRLIAGINHPANKVKRRRKIASIAGPR